MFKLRELRWSPAGSVSTVYVIKSVSGGVLTSVLARTARQLREQRRAATCSVLMHNVGLLPKDDGKD